MKKSIVFKNIVIVIFPVIILTLSTLYFTFKEVSKITESIISETSEKIVTEMSGEISSWLISLKKNAQIFSLLDSVKEMNWDNAKKDLSKSLKNNDFEIVFLATPDGMSKTIIRNDMDETVDGPTPNISDRSYFKDIFVNKKDVSISEIVTSRTTNLPVFVVASAVREKKGDVIGLLGFTVLTDTLFRVAEEIKIGENGYGWIVDSNGLVLTHKNKEYVLSLNVLKSSEKGFNNLDKAGKMMLDGKSGVVDIILPNKKVERLFFHPIKESPGWTLCVSVPIEEIYQKTYKILKFLSYIFFLMFIIIILFTFITNKRIISHINKINIVAEDLSKSSGDLTTRIKHNSNDELGDLSRNVDNFIENIENIVKNTKQSVADLFKISRNLKENSNNTNFSVKEITNNIESIKQKIINQSASTTETLATIEEISKSVESFTKMLENQNASVTEMFATIEEVVANIKSVYDIIEKNKENIANLINKSIEGKKYLEEVVEASKKINSFSEKIVDTNIILNDIVERTDLLSINAAIEAAHAGTSGKGFSVVADEIRKLSENAKKQTKNISKTLLEIKSSISDSVTLAENAKNKYEEILSNIEIVKNQEEFISKAMEEQNVANTQMLTAMKEINDINLEIKSGSDEILLGTKTILEETQRLSESSSSINKDALDIAEKIEEINKSIENLNELIERSNDAIKLVDGLINKFKTN